MQKGLLKSGLFSIFILGIGINGQAQTLDTVARNGNTTSRSIFLSGNTAYNVGNITGESLYYLSGASYLESGNPSTGVLAPLNLKSSLLSINSRVLVNNATDDAVSAFQVNGAAKFGSSTNSGDISLSGKTGATLASRLAEFSNGGFALVNAGDLHVNNYWGVAININKGIMGDNASASTAVIAGTSSFTINSYQTASTLSTLFTVRNSGNVGIGNTTPGSRLTVQDVAGTLTAGTHTVGAFIRSTGSTSRGVMIGYYADGTNETAGMIRTSNNADLLLAPTGGNVGIGTATTGEYKLAVEGTIGARRVQVKQTSWADFVFQQDYQLPSLHEVENYINANKHLSGIPSAEEVAKNGIDIGEMNKKLLQKVEELTLYMIEMKKEIEQLKASK